MSDDEANEKLVAPADFDGPTSTRHCTDVFCLLILIAAWVVMTGIGIYAIGEGDYRLVLYPLDYDGNICGTGASVGIDLFGLHTDLYKLSFYLT